MKGNSDDHRWYLVSLTEYSGCTVQDFDIDKFVSLTGAGRAHADQPPQIGDGGYYF